MAILNSIISKNLTPNISRKKLEANFYEFARRQTAIR